MKKQTKKLKIIACFGYLTLKSTALVCTTSEKYVRNVWCDYDLHYMDVNNRRVGVGYFYKKKVR